MTPNTKAHKSHMELEKVIEDFGDALRNANMEYLAREAGFTPAMQAVWDRYIIYAIKDSGLKREYCSKCGREGLCKD